VGCNGGQLASPDRMVEKKMAAARRAGVEVVGGAVCVVSTAEAMANWGSVVDCGWQCLGVEV
jgi:hypothetical protein